MQAIQTKYIPASKTRGQRFKAWCFRGSITVSTNYSIGEDAHIAVAQNLCDKFTQEDFKRNGEPITSNPWSAHRICGNLKDGTYVNATQTFVLLGDWLCVRDAIAASPAPEWIVNYWPCFRPYAGTVDHFVNQPAHREGGNGSYALWIDGQSIPVQLKDGGQTMPIKHEIIPIPCPPARGKETRWHNGKWQKLLRKGWISI